MTKAGLLLKAIVVDIEATNSRNVAVSPIDCILQKISNLDSPGCRTSPTESLTGLYFSAKEILPEKGCFPACCTAEWGRGAFISRTFPLF
jgi:hypothetical protein